MKITKAYRIKLDLFICGAFLLLCLSYYYGFRKTINAGSNLDNLREQSEIISRSAMLKADLEKRLQVLNDELGDVQVIDDDQEFVLNTIHNNSERSRVRVVEVIGTSSQTENGITRSTYGSTVEGSFTDLVRLVRVFEGSGHEGRIASTTFYRYVDSKSKKVETRLKFYIQEYSAK